MKNWTIIPSVVAIDNGVPIGVCKGAPMSLLALDSTGTLIPSDPKNSVGYSDDKGVETLFYWIKRDPLHLIPSYIYSEINQWSTMYST